MLYVFIPLFIMMNLFFFMYSLLTDIQQND